MSELKIVHTGTHNAAATPTVDGDYLISIIRKQLIADEVYPTNVRWNESLSQVEWSNDGGETWQASPENDPRFLTNVPKRPDPTNRKCFNAASVEEYFRRYITLVTSLAAASATVVQGASAVVGFLGLITSAYGVLWSLIAGAFATIAGYGAGVVVDAFDETVYDDLRCLLYCRLNADGQLDAVQLGGLKTDVTANINSTAAPIINAMLDIMGFAGVNRAALFYTVAGVDCSGCPCDYCADLFQDYSAGIPANTYNRTANTPNQAAAPGLPTWQATGGRVSGGCLVSRLWQPNNNGQLLVVCLDIGHPCFVDQVNWYWKAVGATPNMIYDLTVYNEAGNAIWTSGNTQIGGSTAYTLRTRAVGVANGRYIVLEMFGVTNNTSRYVYISDLSVNLH